MSLTAFTTRFYELMPRELRDMVYGFLLESPHDTWKVIDDGSLVSKPCATRPLRQPRVLRYLSDDMMHRGVAAELAEFFLLQSNFEIEHPCRGLRLFLCKELKTGIKVKDYIRRIVVNIHPHDFHLRMPKNTGSIMEDYLQNLRKDLELLFAITQPFKCRLELYLDVRFTSHSREVFDMLARYVHAARKLGFHCVVYVEEKRKDILHKDEPLSGRALRRSFEARQGL